MPYTNKLINTTYNLHIFVFGCYYHQKTKQFKIQNDHILYKYEKHNRLWIK